MVSSDPLRKRTRGAQKRVSAVGIITGLRWSEETMETSVLHNPYAARPWPDEIIPVARSFGVIKIVGETMDLDWY